MDKMNSAKLLFDWEIESGQIPENLTYDLCTVKMKDQYKITIDSNNNDEILQPQLTETTADCQQLLGNYLKILTKFNLRKENQIQNFLLPNSLNGQSNDIVSIIINTKIELLLCEMQFRAFDRGLYSPRLQNLREDYTLLKAKLVSVSCQSNIRALLLSTLADIDYLKGKEQLSFGNFDNAFKNFQSAKSYYEICEQTSGSEMTNPNLKKAVSAFMIDRTCKVAGLCGERERYPKVSRNDLLLIEDLQNAYMAWTRGASHHVHWYVLTFFQELASVGIDLYGRIIDMTAEQRNFEGLLSVPSLEILLLIEENVRQSFNSSTGRFNSRLLERLSNLRVLKSGGSIINSFYYILSRAKFFNSMNHSSPMSNSVHSYLDLEAAIKEITKISVSGFWFKLYSTKLIEYYVLTRNIVKIDHIVDLVDNAMSDDVAWAALLDDKFKNDIQNMTSKLSDSSYLKNVLSCKNGKALFVNLFHPLDKESNSKVDKDSFMTICEKFGVSVNEFYAQNEENGEIRERKSLEETLTKLCSPDSLENCDVLIVFLTSHGEARRHPGSTESITTLLFAVDLNAEYSDDPTKEISVRDVQALLRKEINLNCKGRNIFCWIIVDACRGDTFMRLPMTPDEIANPISQVTTSASGSRAVGTLAMDVEPEDCDEYMEADCVEETDFDTSGSVSITDMYNRGGNFGSLCDLEISCVDELPDGDELALSSGLSSDGYGASLVTTPDSFENGMRDMYGMVETSNLSEAGETTDVPPRNHAIILTSYSTLNGFKSYVPSIGPNVKEGYSPFVKSVYDVFTLSKVSFEGEGPWRMNSMLKFVNGNMKRFKKQVAKDKDQPYYEVQRCMYSSSNLEDVILVRESIDELKENSESIKEVVKLWFVKSSLSSPRNDFIETTDGLITSDLIDSSESDHSELMFNMAS